MGILREIKNTVVESVLGLMKLAWRKDFPDKEETVAYLNASIVSHPAEGTVTLPEVRNVADTNLLIFPETLVYPSRNYTWKYVANDNKSSLLRIGSVLTNNKVLYTDFGYTNLLTDDFGPKHVFKDFFSFDKRPIRHADTLIAPWSHYMRKEYFMFLLFIAAKICRIKDAMPDDKFDEAIVSYPLYDTFFEKQYLELLGIKPDKIVDSRLTKLTFNECYLGNNDNWLHPNPSDVMSLKKHLEPKLEALNTSKDRNKRIYICRSGRRRVLNEAELFKVLDQFGFEIYEDKPRSVAEQYAIYHNASFIMGPHGSSFGNVVWCQPGTHLFELFPPRYVYNYFSYLATIGGLTYSAYSSGPVSYEFNSNTINDDIVVSVPDLEKYLTEFFKENTMHA